MDKKTSALGLAAAAVGATGFASVAMTDQAVAAKAPPEVVGGCMIRGEINPALSSVEYASPSPNYVGDLVSFCSAQA